VTGLIYYVLACGSWPTPRLGLVPVQRDTSSRNQFPTDLDTARFYYIYV